MIRKLAGLGRVLALTAFAATTVACGELEVPMILEAGEGTNIQIAIPPSSPVPAVVDLEGGLETTLFTDVSLLQILLLQPIVGILQVDDALLAGTPFAILGIPTEEVCIIPGPDGGGGGTVTISRIFNTLTVDAVLDSRIETGSPILSGAFPDGLPFPIEVMSTITNFTTFDLIGLVGGTGDLTLMQEIDEVVVVPVLGQDTEIGVTGQITLSSTEVFPTGPLLDDCIALLGL